MQRRALLAALKKRLKASGLTYAAVAQHLGLSEATVKRLFHRGDLSLSRLEAIGALVGASIAELVDDMSADHPLLTELTAEQEVELIADPKLLLMAYLLVNRWTVDAITERFDIDAKEAAGRLRRLRDLEFIEILPFDRIRVLTARNFRWRRDGPVQRYFIEQVERDFFDAPFDARGEVLYLLGGVLSEASRYRLEERMHRLAAEIDELSIQDTALPRDERQACGAILALRPWEFAAFTRLRRPDADDANGA